jgi:hypothetical protein
MTGPERMFSTKSINCLLNKRCKLAFKLLTLSLLLVLLSNPESNQREYVIGPRIILILLHHLPLIHLNESLPQPLLSLPVHRQIKHQYLARLQQIDAALTFLHHLCDLLEYLLYLCLLILEELRVCIVCEQDVIQVFELIRLCVVEDLIEHLSSLLKCETFDVSHRL